MIDDKCRELAKTQMREIVTDLSVPQPPRNTAVARRIALSFALGMWREKISCFDPASEAVVPDVFPIWLEWIEMADEEELLKAKNKERSNPTSPGYVHREKPPRAWEHLERHHDLDRKEPPAIQAGIYWQRAEWWENKIYYVMADFFLRGFFVDDSEYAVLGISSIDETARHDWRDFQRIKNDIVGDEWEGIELYPAESRLVDPSNRFYLWCVPKGVLRYGLPGPRSVKGYGGQGSPPQRPFR